ncbi:MAG: HAMP domain-containing histidine kinase [Corynebacteriales bacterium]|nr:HAMP domain-containing histidine kinase [Mycobacteriales bacterium]
MKQFFHRPSHWSLRVRLVLAMLLLLVGGLIAQAVCEYTAMREHTKNRVDRQLAAVGENTEEYVETLPAGEIPRFAGQDSEDDKYDQRLAEGGVYTGFLQTRDREGNVLEQLSTREQAPKVGEHLNVGADKVRYFYADVNGEVAQIGEYTWRMRASELADGRGYLIVGQYVHDDWETLDELRRNAIISGSAIVALASLLGWLLVRQGLRPLVNMGITAQAIGSGDLTHRVTPDNTRTEVGRLGHSLNAMLKQLETAFAHQKASEVKLRSFIADASHELRTPLTSIRGYAEMFRRGAADNPEDLATAMRRIESESARMTELVEELLLLARLDENRDLAKRPVNVVELLTDSLADAQAVEPDRSFAFQAPEVVVVSADEYRLRQVFANFLANIRRHTPAGTPAEVRVKVVEQCVRIEFVDAGPGLTADQRAQVFERFWRADKSRTRASGGSGLGLSIVAAIVHAHGGAVGVDSTTGAGAAFWVELPIVLRSQEIISDDSGS